MLYIKNKTSIIGDRVNTNSLTPTNDYYYVYGVYEKPIGYQIHLRSSNGSVSDEVIILKRNRREDTHNQILYKYYEMYDNNLPHNRVGLTKEAIQNQSTLIKGIEDILNKPNKFRRIIK